MDSKLWRRSKLIRPTSSAFSWIWKSVSFSHFLSFRFCLSFLFRFLGFRFALFLLSFFFLDAYVKWTRSDRDASPPWFQSSNHRTYRSENRIKMMYSSALSEALIDDDLSRFPSFFSIQYGARRVDLCFSWIH